MFEIFYYIEKNDLFDILNYGIKLSDNHKRILKINGVEKQFIVGLLNPKDDLAKFNDENFVCVRFLLNNINIKIGEASLYETEYYIHSIVDLNSYKLGQYMNPEVLIPFSILPENIEQINYYIDSPLLYNSSEELYKNNTINTLRETLDSSNDIILHALLDEYKKVNKLEKEKLNGTTLYFSNGFDELYTI